ncbi:hypothetical protein EDD85DRAFT_851111 [Armillaria nabsnona]|nr:hypothetical protein EDD85DRAFT_851111 [Armillaria nabsnona]
MRQTDRGILIRRNTAPHRLLLLHFFICVSLPHPHTALESVQIPTSQNQTVYECVLYRRSVFVLLCLEMTSCECTE